MKTLNHIPLHTPVTVKSLLCAPEFARRLREMGVCPGESIEVVGRSPLGDPLSVKVNRTIFALRAEDAQHIEVVFHEST